MRGLRVGCSNYVIDLSTAERIPAHFEKHFVDNLHRHNMDGIIIAWPSASTVHVSDQAGNEFDVSAHQQQQAQGAQFNYRDEEYVIERFKRLGYTCETPSISHQVAIN